MARKQFYKLIKGPMQNYEDWYYFEEQPDGTRVVIHEWSHVSPRLENNSGLQTYSVDEFLDDREVSASAKNALREMLDEGGL